MHLSTLEIRGYKLFRDKFEIGFEKGLTVLVGENGAGKSAVVDALRLLLLEDEYGRTGVSPSDFHRPLGEPATSRGVDRIELRCIFDGLDKRAQAAYLPWLDIDDTHRALLSLSIENREDQRGRFKRSIWGGKSTSGLFEWELLHAISCVYLPPLRDAKSRLGAYRGSRLARLLRNLGERQLGEGEEHPLETRVRAFNDTLLDDRTIQTASRYVRENVINAIGPVFGQDAMIQFSEVKFERIVERLKLLFYPQLPQKGKGTPRHLFRELDENSLGFNNVLYLATVLAELEDLDNSQTFLKVLLIEEPEAHLHPQLQVKLLKHLQDKSESTGIQMVVTTHSPTIAASAALDTVKVLTRFNAADGPVFSSVADCGLSAGSKFFLERWLDITKSTLLFAKGVILVEGIAEALVMPELARIVIRQLDGVERNGARPESLEDCGVSIINMGGIYFRHFMQLFRGYTLDDQGNRIECDKIAARCAGITDCDPEKGAMPTVSDPYECGNPQHYLVQELENHSNCRLFCNLKTFEYDLAMEGNNLQLMSQVYSDTIGTDGPTKRKAAEMKQTDWTVLSEQEKSDAACWLLQRVSDNKGEFAQLLAQGLSQSDTVDFSVPSYIRQAILWAIGLN
jgi:putative ATP-dependent endonuclease of OLD family